MKLTKTQLKQIIKEEIQSLNEHKKTFDSFKKDFNDVITYSDAYLDGDTIKIYLDTNPNKEKNIINKLVRTKYNDKLKKVRSEDDVMVFKITENLVIKEKISNVLEIGMFHDPIGYKKSEPSKSPYTKEYQKDGTYVIYKNGKVVKSGIEGEGNANAWINAQQRKELNLELRNIVKQTIRENNEPMEKAVSDILAPYFVEYIKKDSFKQSGDEELTTYEFTMVIPKGDEVISGLSNAIDVEEYFEREFGTGSSSGRPGGMFTRTMYEVEENYLYLRDLLVHVMHRVGYDV